MQTIIVAMTTHVHRLARHEAAHAVIGLAVGFRPKLIRIGASGGGLVDLLPDYDQRPEYRDPALAPFPLFLAAAIDDFDENGYHGPLPATLPANGARAVLDVTLILAAGSAADRSDVDRNPPIGSDLDQIRILSAAYPEMAAPIASLLDWMPRCVGMLAAEVEAVAQVLARPSDDARSSWLGTEDMQRIATQFDADRWSASCQIIRSRVRREASAVERMSAACVCL